MSKPNETGFSETEAGSRAAGSPQGTANSWIWWVGGCGCFAVSMSVVSFVLLGILLYVSNDPARIRESLNRTVSLNRLRLITIAWHNYRLSEQNVPASYSMDSAGRPLLSWRVHLLPYLDEVELYRQFHLDEPWDSPHNRSLIPMMPEVYRSPFSQLPVGKTTYLGNAVEGGVFYKPTTATGFPMKGYDFGSFTDGEDDTILLLDVADNLGVAWTEPADFDPPLDAGLGQKLRLSESDTFQIVLIDGTTLIESAQDEERLRARLTRGGGETVVQDP